MKQSVWSRAWHYAIGIPCMPSQTRSPSSRLPLGGEAYEDIRKALDKMRPERQKNEEEGAVFSEDFPS